MTAERSDRAIWTTLIDDARGKLCIEMHEVHGPFLHLTLKEWGLDVARQLRDGFVVMKRTLRACGHTHISVIMPSVYDDKLYRFLRLYGFREVKRGGGQILMRQET